VARKHKPEPQVMLMQGSRLAERARQQLIIGAVVLLVTVGAVGLLTRGSSRFKAP
jgi:hypothetical protein